MPTEVTVPISNMEVLLAKMIENKAGADELGKMMSLFERWQAAEAKKAFAASMNLAQQDMPRVIKDADNSHTRSRYVLLETLQAAIAPVIARHGFSLSWSQGDAPQPHLTRVVATLFHTGGHSERYQGDYPIDGVGAKGGSVMNPLQGTVSAHTYAQKDMLRLMFNITIAGRDLDGNGAGPTLITEAEITEINTLVEQTSTDYDAFLRWASTAQGVPLESLADMTKATVTKALDFLRRKRKEMKP